MTRSSATPITLLAVGLDARVVDALHDNLHLAGFGPVSVFAREPDQVVATLENTAVDLVVAGPSVVEADRRSVADLLADAGPVPVVGLLERFDPALCCRLVEMGFFDVLAVDRPEAAVAACCRAVFHGEAPVSVYRDLVDSQIEMICRWKPDFTLTFVNKGYCEFFGRSRQELIGKSWLELVPQDSRGSVEAFYRQLAADPRPYGFEHEVVDRHGKVRWQQWLDSPLFGARGKLVGFQSVGRDITERKRAELAAEQSRRHLEWVLSTSPAVVYLLEFRQDRAVLTWISGNLKRLWGYDVQTAMTPHWWAANIHPDDRQAAIRGFSQLVDLEKLVHTYRFRHADGSWRWVRDELALLDSKDGVRRAIGTWSDITGYRQAQQRQHELERQLRKAQKLEAVGRLAGGVAHDFNNMLIVIQGHAELMAGRLPADHPLQEDISQILAAARRSAGITRQLLAFSRRQVIQPRPLDLDRQVGDTLKTLRHMIGETVHLRHEPAGDLPPVYMDPSQLDQVLLNLVVNAKEAMEDGGTLTVSTRQVLVDEAFCRQHPDLEPGRFVMLEVADTGCGMDEDILEQIFEPFFTTKQKASGTGLGLATVYGIVKQNKGTVTVDSTPGEGSVFRLYFPVLTVDRLDGLQPEPDALPAPIDARALVVEDDPMVCRLTVAMARRLGMTVFQAESAQKALELIDQGMAVDILITDVVMPEMDGRQLAEQVRRRLPKAAVLYISGHPHEVIARKGVVEEGCHFLAKPFSIGRFGRAVAAAMADAGR